MSRRRSSRGSIPSHIARALAPLDSAVATRFAAIRRPPFRCTLRHEPGDVVDGHPTLELGPTASAIAIAAAIVATPRRCATLLVGAGRMASDAHGGKRLGRSLLVDSAEAAAIAARQPGLAAVARIDGPIDDGDARALERAVAEGLPPLDADLRAACFVQIAPSGSTWSQWREPNAARVFASEIAVRYIASLAGLDARELPLDDAARRCLVRGDVRIRASDVRLDGAVVLVRVRRGQGSLVLAFDREIGRWLVPACGPRDDRD
jgi:hypothetical protein